MAQNAPQFCPTRLIAAYGRRHDLEPREAIKKLLAHDIWPERFRRNYGILSGEIQASLLDLPIFIAGSGGLGGAMAENLVRLGAGLIYLCDNDVFEESNLNRQHFCNMHSLGLPKAQACARALREIAPYCTVVPIIRKLAPDNLPELLKDCKIVIDCLDSIGAKKMLEESAMKLKLPWLHGAVSQQEGFACLESQPSGLLARLYSEEFSEKGAYAVLPHVVNGTASQMCALFLRWLNNSAYSSPLLHIDFSIPELERFQTE